MEIHIFRKKSLEKVACLQKKSFEKVDGTQYDILLYYFHKDSGLEVDFVIRYKGECTLVEVKAVTGNVKSTKTILNHPGKWLCSAQKQPENIPPQTARFAPSGAVYLSIIFALAIT